MDEKIVVGTEEWRDGYVQVFSRNGTYERTLTCNDCWGFGYDVVTLGNLIVTSAMQNDIKKLFIYSTEDGELLKSKSLEQGCEWISAVAMSEQFIVWITTYVYGWKSGKTIIYSNTSPDFPKIAEINQEGEKVAVSGDRIVIGDGYGDGFGDSVAITDDKVIVGAPFDDDQGEHSGSVFIYSAVTGEFIKKVLDPDGETYNYFGIDVCASDSHYVVGSTNGATYLFKFSEE